MGGHKRAPSGAAQTLWRVRRHVLKFVALAALLVPVVAVVADQGEPAASRRDGAPDDSEGQYPEAQDRKRDTSTPRWQAQMSATGTPSPQPTAGRPGAGGLPSDPSPTPAGGPTGTGSPAAGGDDEEQPGSPTQRPSGSPDDAPPDDAPPDSPPGDTPGRPDDTPSSPPSSSPDDEPQPSPSSPGTPPHEPEPEPTVEPPAPPKPSPSETPKPSPPSEPPPDEDDDDGSLVCVILLGIEICL
ncbi:hypothetical protein E1212_27865 [Jiangella ureilytica]|uniref:Uncharacterized protein n=1 Tax=Jiangella ureilytica TaxID=2530374 RepID=A0A4R4RAG1_9ACTN|nr:hypothetical protein [Jiangella ureilytica]TDC45987.1 hypothetical protein E1212_27865 [Jiangella ureilytica]